MKRKTILMLIGILLFSTYIYTSLTVPSYKDFKVRVELYFFLKEEKILAGKVEVISGRLLENETIYGFLYESPGAYQEHWLFLIQLKGLKWPVEYSWQSDPLIIKSDGFLVYTFTGIMPGLYILKIYSHHNIPPYMPGETWTINEKLLIITYIRV